MAYRKLRPPADRDVAVPMIHSEHGCSLSEPDGALIHADLWPTVRWSPRSPTAGRIR
jgi:hypothetical protein